MSSAATSGCAASSASASSNVPDECAALGTHAATMNSSATVLPTDTNDPSTMAQTELIPERGRRRSSLGHAGDWFRRSSHGLARSRDVGEHERAVGGEQIEEGGERAVWVEQHRVVASAVQVPPSAHSLCWRASVCCWQSLPERESRGALVASAERQRLRSATHSSNSLNLCATSFILPFPLKSLFFLDVDQLASISTGSTRVCSAAHCARRRALHLRDAIARWPRF